MYDCGTFVATRLLQFKDACRCWWRRFRMHVPAIRNFLSGIATLLMTVSVGVLPVDAKDRIILNRLGPSSAELYIANADGTGRPTENGSRFRLIGTPW